MARHGYDVTWIAAVPLLSYLKDLVLREGKLRATQEKCSKEGLLFRYLVIPLTSRSLPSFLIRHTVLRWAAKRFATALNRKETQSTIFHARSYDATQLALELKSRAIPSKQWRVSFDMRSIMPEEIPLTRGFIGKALFGFAKQWEHELLSKSDISFLPLNYARQRIRTETGAEIIFSPIHGFDREDGWDVNFEQRWQNRYIGYSGSIGAWHEPDLLLEILQSIPNTHPKLAMSPHPRFRDMSCAEFQYHEMPAYYDSLLALVIPGRRICEDYFVNFQMRCNLFSTKATEALSRGVPLVVSSHLLELANFVREHDCGIVYDPNMKAVVHPKGDILQNKDIWRRLTENAKRTGLAFTRSSVMNLYQQKWNTLFPLDIERSSLPRLPGEAIA